MNKTDVQDALQKLEELTNAELLVTAAQTNADARESEFLPSQHL